MKKINILGMILILSLTLFACAGNNQDNTADPDDDAIEIAEEANDANDDATENDNHEKITANIEGSFVAQVRMIIPGYVLDNSTPGAVVATRFQSSPFIIKLTPEQINQVEENQTYKFTIKTKFIDLPDEDYPKEGLWPETGLSLYNLEIGTIEECEAAGDPSEGFKITF